MNTAPFHKFAAENGLTDTPEPPPDFALLDTRRFAHATRPAKPVPVWTLAGMPTSTAGNLTVLHSQAKTGKSAIVGAMMAAAMNPHPQECDFLGFTGTVNLDGKALVHFDTEQSPFDHDMLVRRAMHRANVTEPPPWLRSYCLTGLSADEAARLFFAELDRAAQECGGLFAVMLDGVADICTDPNDAEGAFGLVAELHLAAIRYDCPLVAVLHENPGSDVGKTRGHLGSQLERKAETPLRMVKEADGSTVIFAERARHGFIPKNIGPRFRWDDEAGMHVSTVSLADGKADARRAELSELATEVFRDTEPGGLAWAELRDRVADLETVNGKAPSLATVKRRMAGMIDGGHIKKTLTGHYIANG